MPRADYRNCRNCGRNATEVGPLSHTRLCRCCSHSLEYENIDGLAKHTGRPFARWRRAMAASVGGVLLDDLPEKT